LRNLLAAGVNYRYAVQNIIRCHVIPARILRKWLIRSCDPVVAFWEYKTGCYGLPDYHQLSWS